MQGMDSVEGEPQVLDEWSEEGVHAPLAVVDHMDGGNHGASAVPEYLKPFSAAPFPVLIMDRSFMILGANSVGKSVLSPYFRLRASLFSDIFGKSLGTAALKEIRQAVVTGASGYSWKGWLKTKSRESGSLRARMYILPALQKDGRPEHFLILLDDVTRENKHLIQSVFMSLLEASKMKDNDTGRHIKRVNLYSERLAKDLYHRSGYEEVDRDFIEDISVLASMHDVGKIGIPDDILNKAGPLEDWEWTIMKEHTKNGAYIFSTHPNPMARIIALYHHERWDGSGYPFQLEGPMIPLAARIVAIADVYDALRMKRCYKDAFDHGMAVEEMEKMSERHFDPAIFKRFLDLLDDFERTYAENADE